MFKKTSLLILLMFGLLFLNHCATSGGNGSYKVKYPNPVTAEAKQEFLNIEKLFEAAKYDAADKLYRNFVKQYPQTELSDKAQFRMGQILMLRQNYSKAVQSFKLLIKTTPSLEMKTKAHVKLGLCYYRLQSVGEALAAFSMVEEKYADAREKVKTSSVAISLLDKEDLNRKAYYLALLADQYQGLEDAEIKKEFGKDAALKAQVYKQYNDWISLTTPIEAIDRRLLDYRGKWTASSLNFKLGKSYYQSQNYSKAKELLKKYLAKADGEEYQSEAQKMMLAMGTQVASVNSEKQIKVGVILPLTGKLEQYGNYMLKGMECAAGIKPECKSGVANIKLVVKDSMGDAQKSAVLVQELAQEKVSLILGPLPSAEVDVAANKADELGVVLVALSQKKGVPSLGESIFRFSLTPETQVRAILKYVSAQNNNHRLAVLYPESNYGQEFVSEIEAQIPKSSVKLVGKQAFSPVKKDLTEEIRQLKLKGAFDAVFIPDSYQSIARVAASFSSAELKNIKVLGTNAWNDASLTSKFNQDLNSGVFVDLFFNNSSNEKVQNFNREFFAAYGYNPATLEAMGYDIVKLVSSTLPEKKSPSKEQVKQSLLQSDYQGVTGLKGFSGNGEAKVDPVYIQADSSGFAESKP